MTYVLDQIRLIIAFQAFSSKRATRGNSLVRSQFLSTLMQTNKRKRARGSRCSQRNGSAVVEFAIVAPLLFLLILMPIFEFGRTFMVSELLSNAAREGCRIGTIRGNSNATITSTVNTILSGQNIIGATTTITVNGGSTDVTAASTGDTVTVAVSIPYNSISWVKGRFMGGVDISATQAMRHE
jgi:hypothetical protein